MFLAVAAAANSAPAGEVDIGGIVVSVSDSFTAQVFHVVDQLSEWDEACHRQYGRWAAKALNFDQQDRAMLQKHAELRRARGWENGFEQAFYVNDSIEAAGENAVRTKLLSPKEAATEKLILLHFAPKLYGLREQGAPQITLFRHRLTMEGKRIAPFVRKLMLFSETEETIRVPLFLIPIRKKEMQAAGSMAVGLSSKCRTGRIRFPHFSMSAFMPSSSGTRMQLKRQPNPPV